MKYALTDYLPNANALAPYQGRGKELSQRLGEDTQGTDQEAWDYLAALQKQGHIKDVRTLANALLASSDAPEVVFDRFRPSQALDMDASEQQAEADEYLEAFQDAIELVLNTSTDWVALQLPAYEHAMALGHIPAALVGSEPSTSSLQ